MLYRYTEIKQDEKGAVENKLVGSYLCNGRGAGDNRRVSKS